MDPNTITARDVSTLQSRIMVDLDALLSVAKQAAGARRHLIALARRLKVDGDLDAMDIGTLVALVDQAVP